VRTEGASGGSRSNGGARGRSLRWGSPRWPEFRAVTRIPADGAAPGWRNTSTPLSTCARLGSIIAKPLPSYAPVVNEMSRPRDRVPNISAQPVTCCSGVGAWRGRGVVGRWAQLEKEPSAWLGVCARALREALDSTRFFGGLPAQGGCGCARPATPFQSTAGERRGPA